MHLYSFLVDVCYLLHKLTLNYSLYFIVELFFGTLQNDPKVYTNYSGFPEKSEALDNNLHTFYQQDSKRDMLWFLRLNSTYEIKRILVSIRGGLGLNYVLSKLSSASNL